MVDASVIIPVYNVEKWLPACLDSVLAQTLESIEAVCVNDASPDGCATILADYAARDPRVRVIALAKNSGQGVARNVGFEASSGRYVYFLDSDDMVAPEALEELVALADAEELDGVLFDSTVVYDNERLAKRHASYQGTFAGEYPTGVMRGRDFFEALIEQRDWISYPQRQLWRSSYLREKGIVSPSLPSHEDEGFSFEALIRAERVAYLRKPFFIRRYREGSVMTSKMGLRDFASYFQCYCEMAITQHRHDVATLGAKRNAARIYDIMVRLYGQLVEEGVDIAAFFEGTDLLDRYLLFAEMQHAHLHYELLSPKAKAAIATAERIYIYGAGIIAGRVYDSLMREKHAIESFLVTSLEGNPNTYKGHHVRALSDVACDRDALVVISLTDGYRAEVEQALAQAGWQFVYYKER